MAFDRAVAGGKSSAVPGVSVYFSGNDKSPCSNFAKAGGPASLGSFLDMRHEKLSDRAVFVMDEAAGRLHEKACLGWTVTVPLHRASPKALASASLRNAAITSVGFCPFSLNDNVTPFSPWRGASEK